MKTKTIGILVCTLLIAASVLPVVGTVNDSKTKIVGETIGSDDQSATWIDANYMPILSDEEYEEKRLEAYKEITSSRGWYWKPSYPNYAPIGMPDFDQKQDQWKTIYPGPDTVLNSLPPAGDDIHNTAENCIAPGPNCILETNVSVLDVAVWSFCGPTAVANCLWWFDSKFADPSGWPGDGKDINPLVLDYTAGDDHSPGNVPLLICKLANAMQTCSKGTTYINDMQTALDQWFKDTGLSSLFSEQTVNAPTFSYIENEIEGSRDVVLLLGFYDLMKMIDQSQTSDKFDLFIPTDPPFPWQKFRPTVNRLDAVQVMIHCVWNAVTVNIYDSIWNLLGSSYKYLPSTSEPTWFQFHFCPPITLTPGATYYISLSKTWMGNCSWRYWHGPPDLYYIPAIEPTSYLGGPHDFTFKTEYGEFCERTGGHYVTCAGVNSENLQIAFSDPFWDIQNFTSDPENHSDPQYVSHDIYNVSIGCPCPDLPYNWYLCDYITHSDYTIVEQAVVITGPTSSSQSSSSPQQLQSTQNSQQSSSQQSMMNTLFFSLFERFSNLFPILQRLLQRLGLQ